MDNIYLMNLPSFMLHGVEYVVVPRADLARIGAATVTTDATERRKALGERLRRAREHAGLTQATLAKRLGSSQPMVSLAESGGVRVGQRYVAAVLGACGVPPTWGAEPTAKRKRARPASGTKSGSHHAPR